MQNGAFHLEDGDGYTWHSCVRGITLEFALKSLGFGFNGALTEFCNRDPNRGTQPVVLVNSDPETPSEYILSLEDNIRVLFSYNKECETD